MNKSEMVRIGAYCLVRSSYAGVFAGHLAGYDSGSALLKDARRIWYWAGAATLSQLSQDGTADPGACKFPCEVPEVYLEGVFEVLPCSNKGKESIRSVPVWAL